MKTLTACAAAFIALILLVSPLVAQNRANEGPRMDSTEPHHSAPTSSMGFPSGVADAGVNSPSVPVSSGSSGIRAGGPSYAGVVANLNRTSFGSIFDYYNWLGYYSYLCTAYNMNPVYFSRFYRNTEPLITPEMLKLTLRGPIRQSSVMLDSIDELEKMLIDAESGKIIDKQALLSKSKSIRELAKKIRKNQTLSHIDLRKEKELYSSGRGEIPSLEALNRMREMALDIDRQLRNLYNQTATSTVSVEDYKQPSLESLAKGIEKICKSIEHSTKRM